MSRAIKCDSCKRIDSVVDAFPKFWIVEMWRHEESREMSDVIDLCDKCALAIKLQWDVGAE